MKNNYIEYFLIGLLGLLLAACTSQPVAPTSASTEVKKTAEKKAKKARMHPLKNGIVSLDVYKEGKTVHLLTGKNNADVLTLWYQKPTNAGKQWSQPIRVNTADAELNVRRGNDAQLSVRGDNIIVAWMNRGYDNRHGAGPMTITYSQDGGQSWITGIAPTDLPKGPHAFIDLESNAQGAHLVWLDSRLGKQAMFYANSTDGGATWSSDSNLDEKTCACCWNTMKSDSKGDLYVLYRDKLPTDMALMKMQANGEQWRRTGRVGEFDWEFEGCPHVGGGLVINETDNSIDVHAIVGTGKADQAGIYYLKSNNGGESFGPLQRMGDGLGVRGDIAVTEKAKLLAVWDMGGPEGMAIYASYSNNNGEGWTKEKLISDPKAGGTHPKVVAIDDDFLVFWTELSSNGEKVLVSKRIEL